MKEEKITGKFKVGDKVRIMDGSKIENYTGNWSVGIAGMNEYIGEEHTIESVSSNKDGMIYYILSDVPLFIWDERGLEEVKKELPKNELSKESIVIYNNGRVVTALNKNTKEKCTAKCNPKDKYDFETGAILAFSRLILGFTVGDKVIGNDKNHYALTNKGWIGVVSDIRIRMTPEFKCDMKVHKEGNNSDYWWVDCSCFDLYTESKDKEINNKKFNMKVVCTKEYEGYTLGKIYEISDGKLIDDDGDVRPIGGVSKFKSLEDLNSGTAKFIKLVE